MTSQPHIVSEPAFGPLPASSGEQEGKFLIFVYGTLRKGESRNRVLQDSEYLGDHITEPRYHMLHLGHYPAVIKNGKTAIVGELYRIDRDTLRTLDAIEGHPTFYRRELIEIGHGYGKAWIYLLTPTWGGTADMRSLIESGDWKNQTSSNNGAA